MKVLAIASRLERVLARRAWLEANKLLTVKPRQREDAKEGPLVGTHT